MTVKKEVRKAEFFAGLKETYGEPVRDRMMAIPDSVHEGMKRLALDTNKAVYECYTEACRDYLRNNGQGARVMGIGHVSADEQMLIHDWLELYRNRKKSTVIEETFNAIRLLVSAAKHRI